MRWMEAVAILDDPFFSSVVVPVVVPVVVSVVVLCVRGAGCVVGARSVRRLTEHPVQ